MISDMIERQKRFSQRFWGDDLSYADKVKWTKDQLLAAMVECGEVLDELSWKVHRATVKPVILSNLREELVDMFKYWLNVWALWGFTENDLYAEFQRKSLVVEARWEQEQALEKTERPIAIVDIDGVLADYPASFLIYAAGQGVTASHDRRDWVRMKHEYREAGVKAFMASRQGASKMMKDLRKRYFVVVLSQRPYFRYKRIFGDTLEWLFRMNMEADALVFTEEKEWFVYQLQERGQRVAIAVEDDADNALKLAGLGVRVYLVGHDYNVGLDLRSGVERIEALDEIMVKEVATGV